MKRTLHLLLFLAGILFAYNGAYAQERKEFVANGYLETSDLSNSSVNIKNEGSQILNADDVITEGDTPIEFADAKVKEICVSKWDTNGDGELSEAEAAAVTSLEDAFWGNREITSFNELQYFKGLTAIRGDFYYCSNLTSIIIPENVKRLEQNSWRGAFQYCTNLVSVSLGEKVEYIASNTFFLCSSLSSISIPKSLIDIGSGAFNRCRSLTSIVVEDGNPVYDSRENCNALIETESNTLLVGSSNSFIPNTVTSIASEAFWGCQGLTSLTIPKKVTKIGDRVFEGCGGLNSIIVEEGNPVYDSRNNCNAIIETASDSLIVGCKSTSIPSDIKALAPSAFSECAGLTYVCIPNGVKNVGFKTFNNCPDLTTVVIGNGVERMEAYAFYSPNISEIYCNAEQAPIEYQTFGSPIFDNSIYTTARLYVPAASIESYRSTEPWSEFGNIMPLACDAMIDGIFYLLDKTKGEATVTYRDQPYDSYSGDVVIPASVDYDGSTYQVTGIAKQAFYTCSKLTSVSIPNSVTTIGQSAFQNCRSLAVVNISNGVKIIQSGAFSTCPALANLNIPASVVSIERNAFGGCGGLENITVESGNTVYDSRESCNALIETATNTIIVGCNNTIIPNSVTAIGSDAFANCSGITSINIHRGISAIGSTAFAFCSGLETIIVEEGNPNYDSRENCNAIIESATNTLIVGCKNTIIPNSVTAIGDYAFEGQSELANVHIPYNITSIGRSAFYECTSLTSINIPIYVTKIEDYVFRFCRSLERVVIPNGVTTIKKHAFYSCSNLKDVYCFAEEVPTTSSDAFGTSYLQTPINTATLHVPAASIEAYSNAEPWKNFGSIIALTDEDPKPTGITNINSDTVNDERYYSLDGMRMAQPQRGLNIIRKSDGTAKKVVIK